MSKFSLFTALLAIALVMGIAPSLAAQKVGDTVQVGGEPYTIQSISGDTITIKKTPGLDGTWVEQGDQGRVVAISGNTGVFRGFGSTTLMQNAINQGVYAVGGQYLRNLTKTGDLTWSGQEYGLDNSGNNVRGASWKDCTITLSADGRSFQFRRGSWRQNFIRQ